MQSMTSEAMKTRLDAGPDHYLRVYSISNGNATANATNVVVRVIRKTIKPSP